MVIHPEIDLDQSLEELRHNALGLVVPGLGLVGMLWLVGSIIHNGIATRQDYAPFALIISMAIILGVRSRHPNLACWLLLPALAFCQSIFIYFYPNATLIYVGIVSIILLSSTIGPWQAIVGAVVIWFASTRTMLAMDPTFKSELWISLLVFALATSAVWLAGRSLRVAVSWALTGWQRAQEALDEARSRRGELHRSLRALEEATYRIERMNNELILARGHAEAARADKAQFVATVSHELRSPLNLILGFSRLMALSPERYRHPLPTDYRADVVTIYRNSEHLATLVDDILDMAQIEAERLPLIKEWVDLEKDVINDALGIAGPLAERKELRMSVHNQGAVPALLVDKVRIRQVLINLLTNATRYTERGEIALWIGVEEASVVVSVSDTGPGIAQSDLASMFGAFRRFSTADRVADRGSGLGLAISKQLVELHGGKIWAESQIGIGTKVSFSLPLPGTTEVPVSKLEEVKSTYSSHMQDHVFVLHQEPKVTRFLGRYLEGYRVIGLPSSTALGPAIEQMHPRAVIAAPDLLHQVSRELDVLNFDVPLITCGMPQDEDKVTQGILRYLLKPVSREVLVAAIDQLPNDGQLTVLVVDDDPDAARLIENTLLAIPPSCRIIKAYDGMHALAIMEEIVPDVALVDLMMPGMGGEELVACMQSDKRLASVPVIIVSSRDQTERPFAIDLPIAVSRRGSLSAGEASRCLLAILEAVAPRYLPSLQAAQPTRGPDQQSP